MQTKQNIFHLLWLVAVAGLLISCSTDTTSDSSIDKDMDGIPGESIRYVVYDVSRGEPTRAAYEKLSQFSETVLNARGGTITKDNLIYNAGGGVWVTTESWTMPKSGNVTAYGISPTSNILSDRKFDKSNRYFDYVVPTTGQTVIKIGSKLNFTAQTIAKEGALIINFKNATAALTIRATNKLQLKLKGSDEKIPVQVYVKSVTLHNIKQKGRFNFSTTKNTDGSWTLDDEVFANYTQELQIPQLVTNGQTTPDDIIDSLMILLPQSPEKWAWSAKGKEDAGPEDAISVADADHKCYVELKCAITADIDGTTYYVYGSSSGGTMQYESIYLPYNGRNASPKYATVGAQGVYIVRITETTALDLEGKPIKPHEATQADQFRDAEFINVSTSDENGNDIVDDWEDEQEPEVVTL